MLDVEPGGPASLGTTIRYFTVDIWGQMKMLKTVRARSESQLRLEDAHNLKMQSHHPETESAWERPCHAGCTSKCIGLSRIQMPENGPLETCDTTRRGLSSNQRSDTARLYQSAVSQCMSSQHPGQPVTLSLLRSEAIQTRRRPRLRKRSVPETLFHKVRTSSGVCR